MLVASLALGLAAVLVAARWVSGQGNVAVSKVVVASRDLPPGTRLAAEHLRVVDWPEASIMSGAFSDPKLLEARVIISSAQRGVPIVEEKLASSGSKGGLSAVIANGKRAMTVKVNEIVGVAGFALPGNHVDVVMNARDLQSKPVSKIVLEQILVLAVAQEAGREETKPKVVNAVTLEVTPAQAEKLDLGRSIGTLSLVLRNQGDRNFVTTPGTRVPDLIGAIEAQDPVVQAAAKPETGKGASARQGAGAEVSSRPRKTVEVIRGVARGKMEMSTSE